jgi:DNA-binding winged helix-turn-helix (wHTH) protein/TolB-like protein
LYEFCRFRFDPDNHLLENEGRPISLTPKAFEVLSVLVENGNRLTTKEELMRRVWPDSFVEDANLTVTISALRKQLGETPDGRQCIETVPKKGYRFAVPVSVLPANHDARISRSGVAPDAPVVETLIEDESPSVSAQNPTRTTDARARSHSLVLLILGLLAVVVVGLGYRAYRNKANARQASQLHRRLAILPFQNLHPDANTDFLGFSLADAIITKLGYVSELSVRPSYAVQKYRAQPIDIKSVASQLDADTLLTGTFLHEGENLRIACQLIDVKSESLLWKGTFDLKYDKLLTVQEQVAQQVIQGLELTLSGAEAGRLRDDETVSPLAYEYYLRGVDLYSKGDFPMAIKMLEKAVELAPKFALAWANLGHSYNANASFQMGGAKYYRMAEAAFIKALTLDPGEIDARIYIANMFTDTGRVEKAVPLLRDALKTNANHAEIHWELGYAYRFAGMLPESVSECERARQLDPGVKLNSSTPNGYLYLGQYDRFLNNLPNTNDVALIVFYRGLGEYYKKNSEVAQSHFEHAYELDRSLLQAEIGKSISLGMERHNSAAVELLHQVEVKVSERGMIDPEAIYKVAQAYAVIGDRTSALRVLRHSIENGFFPYPYLVNDPILDPLRTDAEFSRLIDVARQRHEQFKKRFF